MRIRAEQLKPVDAAGDALVDGQYVLDVASDVATWVPESSGGSLEVEDEGVSEATGVTVLNFTGSGVTATDAGGGTVDVNIGGASGGTYSTYTPALTASTTNPTLGTGSAAHGRYCQDGDHVYGDASIKFGSSGTGAGSGNYAVSLPVAQRTLTGTEGEVVGHGWARDDNGSGSPNNYITLTLIRLTATTASLVRNDIASNTPFFSNTVPWSWAALDRISYHFDYEAA